MKTYKIKYITLEGDTDTVIIEAYSKEDAKVQLKREILPQMSGLWLTLRSASSTESFLIPSFAETTITKTT